MYRQLESQWDMHQLAEWVVNLDGASRQISIVERVIGFKRGTGGVSHLRTRLDVRCRRPSERSPCRLPPRTAACVQLSE